MAHDHISEHETPEEKNHRLLVQRGDDYHRIELYRWALHYYKRASETGIPDDSLSGKIDMVAIKIRKETRTILAVIGVAIIAILAFWLLV